MNTDAAFNETIKFTIQVNIKEKFEEYRREERDDRKRN